MYDAGDVVTPITVASLEDRMTSSYENWMLAHNLRPRTIAQRVQFCSARIREWRTFDHDSAFLAEWLRDFDGWTALTYYTHLRSIYRWLTETGRMESNPTEALRRPPTPRANPKPLSQVEVDRALDGTTGHLRTWMLLALLAGLRSHEVAKLRGEDVTATAIYVLGKGGQTAYIPTHPDLWTLAQDYPRTGYWFPSPINDGASYSRIQVGAKVAERFRKVGIESGSIHRLRATYGTNLVRRGADLRLVQKLMRHSSLATTEHYLGVDEDELMAAIKLLAA